ncbi:phage tail protein [Methylobacterium indicum]|uniref:phage tail protein n=1 Tax=Methylobacterium indicum TaxID=1775910 RepID=UPI002435F40C|nr:tail fiber protein [Methylobacterium indicum]
MEPMLGMIFMIPWNWAPNNYALCQGQTLTVQQYTALYSLMGLTFGGSGNTNFNLPDLQGRAPIGTGVSQGTSFPLAMKTGTPTTTLGLGNLPVHNHGATFKAVTGSQTVTIPGQTGTQSVQINASTAAGTTGPGPSTVLATIGGSNKIYGAVGSMTPLASASAGLTGTAATAGQTFSVPTVTGGTVEISAAGGGQPFTNYQPSLAMSFIIALVGLYPERP